MLGIHGPSDGSVELVTVFFGEASTLPETDKKAPEDEAILLGWPVFPRTWKQIDKEGMGTAVASLEDISPTMMLQVVIVILICCN